MIAQHAVLSTQKDLASLHFPSPLGDAVDPPSDRYRNRVISDYIFREKETKQNNNKKTQARGSNLSHACVKTFTRILSLALCFFPVYLHLILWLFWKAATVPSSV